MERSVIVNAFAPMESLFMFFNIRNIRNEPDPRTGEQRGVLLRDLRRGVRHDDHHLHQIQVGAT